MSSRRCASVRVARCQSSSGAGPAICTIDPSGGGRRAGTLASRSPPRRETNAWCTAPSARDSSWAMESMSPPLVSSGSARPSVGSFSSGRSSSPSRPDDDAPSATESARVRSPRADGPSAFNSATRRVNRSPRADDGRSRAGDENARVSAPRASAEQHLFCWCLVRRSRVATHAGAATAWPALLANISPRSPSSHRTRAKFPLRSPRTLRLSHCATVRHPRAFIYFEKLGAKMLRGEIQIIYKVSTLFALFHIKSFTDR